jgi:hypothetical protein
VKRADLKPGMTVAYQPHQSSRYRSPAMRAVVLDTRKWRTPERFYAHKFVDVDTESGETIRTNAVLHRDYDKGAGNVLIRIRLQWPRGGAETKAVPLAHLVGDWDTYVAQEEAAKKARDEYQAKAAKVKSDREAANQAMLDRLMPHLAEAGITLDASDRRDVIGKGTITLTLDRLAYLTGDTLVALEARLEAAAAKARGDIDAQETP